MGALSRLGRARRVDTPKALELASGGRGSSYDSGDAVSVAESGKRTPLVLTSDEIGGKETVGCIVWEVTVVGDGKRGGKGLRVCTARGQGLYILGGTLRTSSGS